MHVRHVDVRRHSRWQFLSEDELTIKNTNNTDNTHMIAWSSVVSAGHGMLDGSAGDMSLCCVDVDECSDEQVRCPVNQRCFNTRGGYECVDTSCPPDYDRDPNTGSVSSLTSTTHQ